MSGYAQNPSSPSDPGYASLTAGLLARKGEAMPAVDADAHAGIDIEMHQAVSANIASKGFVRPTVEALYAPNAPSYAEQNRVETPQARAGDEGAFTPPGASETWAISSLARRLSKRREKQAASTAAHAPQRKATVRFRMSVQEFVRLRFASRDMEMSCQSIILEALDCYIDANDIAPVTQEECKVELNRLSEASARKRAASKTVAADEER